MVTTFLACRKTAIESEQRTDFTERFFKTEGQVTPQTAEIIKQLKQSDNINTVAAHIINRFGNPAWQQTLHIETPQQVSSGIEGNSTGNPDETVHFIPITNSQKEVVAYIATLQRNRHYFLRLWNRKQLATQFAIAKNQEAKQLAAMRLSLFYGLQQKVKPLHPLIISFGERKLSLTHCSFEQGNQSSIDNNEIVAGGWEEYTEKYRHCWNDPSDPNANIVCSGWKYRTAYRYVRDSELPPVDPQEPVTWIDGEGGGSGNPPTDCNTYCENFFNGLAYEFTNYIESTTTTTNVTIQTPKQVSD